MSPMNLSMRVVLASFLGATNVFVSFASGQQSENPRRPDIVVFLADDLSVLDASVYGSLEVRTPSVDRLAKAGLTLDRAFVASPSCAPSRAALLTGLMPARNGAEANHSKAKPELATLPEHLAKLGYETVAFGKVAHYQHAKYYGFERAEFEGFHDHRGIDAAVEFLAARDKESAKPLFLCVGTNWPHRPWPKADGTYKPADVTVPPTHVDTPKTREFRARYLQAVEMADDDLGKIYDAATTHLGPNTLFLYSSDHGAQWPFGKWNCYEAGLHVPMVAVWPGVIEPNQQTDAMVSWIDVLPTLIEAAGGEAPKAGPAADEIDGRSFLPVLKGDGKTHRERIFGTHSGDQNMNVYPIRSVRDGRWKYVRNLHPEFQHTTHVDRAQAEDEVGYFRSWERFAARGDAHAAATIARYRQRPAEELYDLDVDPHETQNLAGLPEQQERLTSLRGELDAWMKEQGDEGTVFGEPLLLPKSDVR
jgi:N-sulfoglucosamine sulfohydrolase